MPGFPAPSPKRRDSAYRTAAMQAREDASPPVKEVTRPELLDPEVERRRLVKMAVLEPDALEELPAERPVDRRLVFVVPLALAAVASLAFGMALYVSAHEESFVLASRWLIRGIGGAFVFGWLAYKTYSSPSF